MGCSQPATISLHKAVPGNACVRSTQITGASLQSTDNDFSTQGGPWQCMRAFHTNNRVAPATTIPLHKAVPGNACVRSTQITGSPLQSTENDFSTKAVPGNACVRSTQITGSSLQSTDDNFSTQGGPWQCVRAFHTNNRVVSAVDRQRYL